MKKCLHFILLLFFAIPVSAQITSTFDTDADGWTFSKSGTLTPNYSASGGNPGGFVSITYSSFVSTNFSSTEVWKAPAKFLGNKVTHSMDMNIRFDLQASHTGVPSDINGDIIIRSTSNVIVYTLPAKPAITPAWSSYSIKLDETQGWKKSNSTGALATRNDIIEVLTNITSIEIRGTYATNASYTSGLDNVILEQRTLNPTPVASSLSATSGKSGDVITINGSGFNTTATANTVRFGTGGIKAIVQSASATQLTVVVPQNASYGPIVVTNTATGLSTTSAPFSPTFEGGGRIIPASFKPKVDIPTIQIESIAVADIDGDGWNDLALTNDFTDRVIDIYRNLGLGGSLSASSFATKVTLSYTGVNVNDTGLWFADLDGDGKPDAVTSNFSFYGVYVAFRNTSTPGNISFEAPEYWRGASDESPIKFVGDLDGDGRPELVSGEGAIPGGFWLNQNISTPGNIEFGGPVVPVGLPVVNGFTHATATDLNGDGMPELIVTNGQGQAIDVLQNTSTPGNPSFIAAFQFGTNQYTNERVLVADMNLDGKTDLIYKTSGEPGFHIRLNTDTDGTLTAADFATDVIFTGDLSQYGGISIADINGDGKPDIAASDGSDVGVYENIFSGGLFDANSLVAAYQYEGTGMNTMPTGPSVADLNGDGKPEIIVGYTNLTPNDKFSIYENVNVHAPVISLNTVSPLAGVVGSTVTITGNNFSTVLMENTVLFGAVKATVLTAAANQLTVTVPVGASYAAVSVTKAGLTSKYHLPFQTTFSSGVTFNATHFAAPVEFTLTGADYDMDIGDLDNDGKPDIVAEGGTAATTRFRNTHMSGSISTASLTDNGISTNMRFPHLRDVDGDGLMDMAGANRVLKNNSTTGNISFMADVTVPNLNNFGFLNYGDINHDGKTDLIVPDASLAVRISENRSANVTGNFVTGTFASFEPGIAISRPAANGSIVVEDFDNDGYPDMIVSNSAIDNISIYRNAQRHRVSTNSFAASVELALGDATNRIVTGDLDRDGKLDVLITHGAGTTATLLVILHNQSTPGNISFNRIDLTNPSVTTTATIADLDGDGKPEIITTSEAGNRFSIFKNLHITGALTATSFAAPFNTTVTAPRGVITGDINLDGKPEIIITRAAGFLLVYENLVPSFTPPTITSFTPASGPVGTTVTITGTNFDTTPANNIVYFGATQATVTAATATQLTITVPVGATYLPISVSVNNLTAYSSEPFVTTFTGGGTIDACSFAPKQDLTAGTTPLTVMSGDFDGDGKADMVVANYNTNALSVFGNTSNVGAITFAAKIDLPSEPGVNNVSVGDMDGDGKLDLATTNDGSNTVSIFRNTSSGAGAISFAARVNFTTLTDPRTVAIDDFDKDGKPDLVLANYGAGMNSISVFRNTSSGTGNINYAARLDFIAGTRPASVYTRDLDGDGKPDIVAVNQDSNTASVYRNTSSGAGNISFAAKIDFTTGSNPGKVAIGDLDDDGKPDIAVVNGLGGSSVSIFRNTSSGVGNINFAAKVDFLTGSVPSAVSIGDIDGDSKLDFAVTGGGNVSLFRNTGSAGNIAFASQVDFITGSSSHSSLITDFDGDGKPDLVASSIFGVHVLRNTISVSPTIASFTPGNGTAGTAVTITGTNFSSTPADNIVKFFNDVTATVTASTSTSITTTVPTGAATGTISVAIGCNTAISTANFTVGTQTTNQPPVIEETTTAVPIEGIVTLDLEPLISDPDDNLDPASLYLVNSVSEQGASASLQAGTFMVTLDYGGIQFFGTDRITIGVCDLASECAEEELSIEVGGDVIVYNAVSPDGNGLNETFVLQYIDILPDATKNHVSIFNRWGDLVFEVTNYNNTDRVFKGIGKGGKELPSGTYYYKIEFSGGRKTQTGYLSLKR